MGDGHQGRWKIISQLNPGKNRGEILDWYHFIENLYKVGWSLKRLAKAKDILWKGQSDRSIDLFKCSRKKNSPKLL